MIIFVFCLSLFSLAPSSSSLTLSFVLKKDFLDLSLYDSMEVIENSIDDIPLYLGGVFSDDMGIPFDFRKELLPLLHQAQQRDRIACLSLLIFFYACEGLAYDFQRLLCSNKEFVDIVKSYSHFDELLKDLTQVPFLRLSPERSIFFFIEDFIRIFKNKNLLIDTGLDRLVQSFPLPHKCLSRSDFCHIYFVVWKCHQKLSDRMKDSLLNFIDKNNLMLIMFRYLSEYDSLIEQSDLFYLSVSQFLQKSPLHISGLIKGSRFYQKALLEFPLYCFKLSTIMENYREQGFSSPSLVFERALSRVYCLRSFCSLNIILKNLPPDCFEIMRNFDFWKYVPEAVALLMKEFRRTKSFSFRCRLGVVLEGKESRLLRGDQKLLLTYLTDIWTKASGRYVQSQDILNFLASHPDDKEKSSLLSVIPFSWLSDIINQASPSFVVNYTAELSNELVSLFVLPEKSSFHHGLFSFLSLHQNEPFQIDPSLPFHLSQLQNLFLLGRTIYGYDRFLKQWVAYKFLKVGEKKEELIRGENIHRFFVQTGGKLFSRQVPLGLFQTEGLSETFFMTLFPTKKETLRLIQFNEDNQVFYRKYVVPCSCIFHYTYESSYSFQESSEGIWASLKEASFFWLHRVYFDSVASFFHNSLSNGRRYFTGTLFFKDHRLGKLNNWNTESTNYSDFRRGGLADREDCVGEVTKELDENWNRALVGYGDIFDKDKGFAMSMLCDYLLLADLLTFRKYLSVIDTCEKESDKLDLKVQLIENIKMNYVTVWSSLTGDSEELSKEILSDKELFLWSDYVSQFLSIAVPDLKEVQDKLAKCPFDMYKYGLTPSGHYKRSLSSEGINLGAYNGAYSVTHFVTLVQRFFILLYQHQDKYLKQAQKMDFVQNPIFSFHSCATLSAS